MRKYVLIAKGLGLLLPACMIVSTASAETMVKDTENNEVAVSSRSAECRINDVKKRFLQSHYVESLPSSSQLDHTNVHADYTIDHTNVHTDIVVSNRHSNQHTNTPSKYVNHHSNSPV